MPSHSLTPPRPRSTPAPQDKLRVAEADKKKTQVILDIAAADEDRRKKAAADAVTAKVKEDEIRRLAEQVRCGGV